MFIYLRIMASYNLVQSIFYYIILNRAVSPLTVHGRYESTDNYHRPTLVTSVVCVCVCVSMLTFILTLASASIETAAAKRNKRRTCGEMSSSGFR